MVYRLFVEKKDKGSSAKLQSEISTQLKIDLGGLREVLRYDIEGIDEQDFKRAAASVFSEPPVDTAHFESIEFEPESKVFAVSFLEGQYDQRADSAAQCVQLLTGKQRPLVACAKIYALKNVSAQELERIKKYLINPVESEEVSLEKPKTLVRGKMETADVEIVEGFIKMPENSLLRYYKENGFAMSFEDLKFVQNYFLEEGRNPYETELKVIDTYWSDHCRHTTFLTELTDIEVQSENPETEKALELYRNLYKEINADRADKYPCLMDIATIAAKKLRKDGFLPDLDISDEINACSINVKAKCGGKEEDYVVMFKNETHNHPTEIEPFGGAATCLGGAIRDPLSGRVYVYQSMRITGSGNPTVPIEQTIKGKLPQRVITQTAAAGFASYGNQIGLATGIVDELYHEGYRAKRLEAGFVVGAARRENIRRAKPEAGDVIILLGGETGRDGCGGATGSSKAHDRDSVDKCGAEVQKGNPLTERKIMRLFTDKELTLLIKKCNDFGAGGVCVAIGELADGVDIDLDKIPKKYEGLSGTELAISESQERMAVVVAAKDAQKFIELAAKENVAATAVAAVTAGKRMRMSFKGKLIVDISREFLDTNGVKQTAKAIITDKLPRFFDQKKTAFKADTLKALSDLNVCSKKGLSEMFDSTIGARTVYMPFGGKYQLTPAIAMAAKIPSGGAPCDTATVAAYGCQSELLSQSPFVGAVYSVICSVAKLIASGVKRKSIYLTFQEYFMRLGSDARRWGAPVSALLGALRAQDGLKLGAIGGKDSMSGSFEDLDVPPTLISFALGTEEASFLITNVAPPPGNTLYFLPMKKTDGQLPDFEYLNSLYDSVYQNIKNKNITFATVVESGGIAPAVIKSCLGNRTGFEFSGDTDYLLSEHYGDLIVSAKDITKLFGTKIELGKTTENGYVYDKENISVEEAERAFTQPLENVFPASAEHKGNAETSDFNGAFIKKAASVSLSKGAKPRVFIPVFPGTNCEYDTAIKFEEADAQTDILVFKNRTVSEIEESVAQIAKRINSCNIIAFAGGFSGGDEPAGSGKFIATTFMNPLLSDCVHRLLNIRDGLILGICNGFQALIKLGLVPEGKIAPMSPDSPTLTYNRIGRHVSSLVSIRVGSNLSPWLNAVKTGDVFNVAVSHGEGRFTAPKERVEELIKNGQAATQYVDLQGRVTMQFPYNPNGSAGAIEGITSPDGRVFGKMGHSERIGDNLMKNFDGSFDMKIFKSGVNYFK